MLYRMMHAGLIRQIEERAANGGGRPNPLGCTVNDDGP